MNFFANTSYPLNLVILLIGFLWIQRERTELGPMPTGIGRPIMLCDPASALQ